MRKNVTGHIKPPRAVFLPLMMEHHLGVSFKSELQREIILMVLGRIEKEMNSGDIYFFPKA